MIKLKQLLLEELPPIEEPTVWLGLVDSHGAVHAAKLDPTKPAHSNQFGMTVGNRWRWRDDSNTVFWWEIPSEEEKVKVTDWMHNKFGFEPKHAAVTDPNDKSSGLGMGAMHSKYRYRLPQKYRKDLKEVTKPLEKIGEDPDETKPDMPVNWEATDIQILDVWNPKTIREFMSLPNTFQAIYPAILETSDLDPRFAKEEEEFGEWGGYEWDDFRHNKGGFPPILVRRNVYGHVLMADGNHRVKWAQNVGYKTIAAWVVDELIQQNIESKSKTKLKELEYPLAKGDDVQAYGGMAGWKGKIIWMTPDKFLRLAAPLVTSDPDYDRWNDLETKMKTGKPLDFLVLHVDIEKRKVTGHEGRHRAIVAKKLGIKKVPVLIYTGSNFKRVPQWDEKDHARVDRARFKPELELK